MGGPQKLVHDSKLATAFVPCNMPAVAERLAQIAVLGAVALFALLRGDS